MSSSRRFDRCNVCGKFEEMAGLYKQCRPCRNQKQRDGYKRYSYRISEEKKKRYRSDSDYREDAIVRAEKRKESIARERLKKVPPPANAKVYFVQEEGTRFLKIGYTAQAMEVRLESLQTGNPRLLKVLLTVPGSTLDEALLLRRFKKDRIRSEWFNPSNELLEHIAQLQKGPKGST